MNNVLAWIDVETTGLNPFEGEQLLEVACILTDTRLNVLDEPFHRVVHHPEYAVEMLKDRSSDYVRQMHEGTGLWDKLPRGVHRMDVDTQLRDYIARHAPRERQARLAGNSVRLDLNFLEKYLPESYEHLHYRFVDVTGLEFLLYENGLVEPGDKTGDHTALADIRSAIDQARGLLEQLTEVHFKAEWEL